MVCTAQLLLVKCVGHEWCQISTFFFVCVCVQYIYSLYTPFWDSFHVPVHFYRYQHICSRALKDSKTVGALPQVGANRSVATLLVARVSSLALMVDVRCASHDLVLSSETSKWWFPEIGVPREARSKGLLSEFTL